MNPAYFHLLGSHLPICGVVFGLGLLLWARFRQHDELVRAALAFCVLGALAALPAYLTGEPSQRLLAASPGIARELVEQHAEMAQLGLGAVALLGLAALAALVAFRTSPAIPAWMTKAILLLGLVALFFLGWTANLGGRIHHPEIRAQAG